MRLVAAAKEKLKAQRASIIMNEDGSSTVKVQEGGSISASQLPGGVEAIVSATYGDGEDIMQPTHRYRQQDCTGLFKAALGANSDRPFKVSNGALGGDIPGLVGKRKCVVIQLRPIGDDVEASAHTAAAGDLRARCYVITQRARMQQRPSSATASVSGYVLRSYYIQ